MNSPVVILSLFGGLWLIGTFIAFVLAQFQCSKQDWWVFVREGGIWASVPALVYTVLEYSPFVRGEFSQGVQYLFGWTGFTPDDSGRETVGMAYALVLAGLIVTTRMVHTVDVSVCKPDVNELSAFTENLMKSLKQKQDNEINKPGV
jgi:hypothetical protein